MNRYSVQDLPLDERPRERLKKFGSDSLTTVELLAILLGTGTKDSPVLELSQQILTRFGSPEKLSQATLQELCEIHGLGEAKALKLQAAFSLGVRASQKNSAHRQRISTPTQAYQLVREQLEPEVREVLVALLLDTKGFLIAQKTVAIGTLVQVLVHPREVFHPAIRHKAASLIIVHNHPSGDPTPSPDDFALTDALIKAGRLIQIPIQDHLIIGRGCYVSLKQHGVQF